MIPISDAHHLFPRRRELEDTGSDLRPLKLYRDGVDGARCGIWLEWSCAKMVVVEQPI
ncbi:MAG TPA: hypothetical protein VFX71_03655 [Hyphomicrobium sp.]|nr:hypothetical protein [Hyphomicrobium sp.]